MERRKVAVLGSTGSIGRQALEVIEAMPDRFQVVSLAAGRNVDLLARQVARTGARLVAAGDPASAAELRQRVGPGVQVVWGPEGLMQAALDAGADVVVVAVVGAAGLVPTVRALAAGKRVALANKEALVAGGRLVVDALRSGGGTLLPVDSEHSAIFQCLEGEERRSVRRLVLTASGGPFRTATLAEMERATPREALRHPTWSMGGKITVDSATLMNKGLEVIEAHWLFGVGYDQIRVLVHPQSIVHSLVEFVDGSVKAQLGTPDMRLPIQYALCYPDRVPRVWSELSLAAAGALTFEEPDFERFPCLGLAYEAGRAGGTAPAVLNAANEVAVHAFLDGKIGFLDIARCVERVLGAHTVEEAEDLDTVLGADAWARREAEAFVARLAGQ
nr:1-deoxy-D-xylulose-5-phosphate reductoisomerase [Bacillota bacterium]